MVFKIFVFGLCTFWLLDRPLGYAAEKKDPRPMTQGELAVVIVKALGEEDKVEADKGELAYIEYLKGKGIEPIPKWKCDEKVTKTVLAVVIVQALGLVKEVENPKRVDCYINVLKERDISLEDVQKVLNNKDAVNKLVERLFRSPIGNLYETELKPITGK